MIVFDLRCSGGHVFEAWFASTAAWEEQRAAGLVACAVCGDVDVAKAVMAPNVAAKANKGGAAVPAPTAETMKAAMAALAQAQAEALKTSQWVGRSFADRARAMHDGVESAAPIHGQATREEARALADDGVAVMPLIVPVVPPEARN